MDIKQLPSRIRKIAGRMEATAIDVGMSTAGVFRLASRGRTYYLKYDKSRRQGADFGLERDYEILSWLEGRLPVPKIVEWQCDGGYDYLIMTEMPGKMLIDDEYLSDPKKAVSVLADGLRILHSLDISCCPISYGLDEKLSQAARFVKNGEVDTENWNEGTEVIFGEPEKLLKYLKKKKPAEDPVFTHGDYCLPNVFGEGKRLSGFIDVRDMGVADRWQDIALCIRSMWHNFGTRQYDHELLKQIGVPMDEDKLEYYILLDELF